MPLHIFRHIETQHFHAHNVGKLAGNFRLAHTRRPGEEVRSDRLFRLTQPGARQFDGRRQRFNRLILTKDNALQLNTQIFQFLSIRFGNRLRRNARHGCHDFFNLFDTNDFLATGRRLQHLPRTRFVDHINRFVGQFPVMHILGRQIDRRLDRIIRVAKIVKLLKIGFETLKDFHRIRH